MANWESVNLANSTRQPDKGDDGHARKTYFLSYHGKFHFPQEESELNKMINLYVIAEFIKASIRLTS